MEHPAKKPTVLVIGSANMDLIARVPRCPAPGESLVGRSFRTVPGGKGANQAIALARLEARTHFSGCVGSDEFGMSLVSSLRDAGVDIAHLKGHSSTSTGTAMILVDDEGENSIIVTPGANDAVTAAHIDELAPLFERLDAVLLQLEIPLEAIDAALDMAERYNVLSVLDLGPVRSIPDEILQKAAVVSPNESELAHWTGQPVTTYEEALEAGRALQARGAREVVLKLSKRGSVYLADEPVHAPAFEVRALDTVAAGDAFTAALTARWGVLPPNELLRFANAAGALACTVEGAQPAMPWLRAVNRFLAQHQEAAT